MRGPRSRRRPRTAVVPHFHDQPSEPGSTRNWLVSGMIRFWQNHFLSIVIQRIRPPVVVLTSWPDRSRM